MQQMAGGWWAKQVRKSKAGEKEATLSLLSDSPTSNYQTRQRTSTAPHTWATSCCLNLSPVFYSFFRVTADEAAVMENGTQGCESVTQDVMAEVISPGPNFSGN